MKVVFNELRVKNFRQIAEREFNFSEQTNYIVAQNGAGKTNIFHAITWCLFGKDFTDRTRFEIVPLNPDNTPTKLEPDVTLTLTVDGAQHELRRELKGGKVTQVYIDDAPCATVKEYDDFVAKIFSTQDRFKMYTNPLFFPEMHWKEQRELFMQFFPLPKDQEVLEYLQKKSVTLRSDLAKRLESLSPEKLQDKVKLDQTKIEDDRARIRSQIALLDDMLEDTHTFDESEAKAELELLRSKVSGIQAQISEASQSNAEIANRHLEHTRIITDLEAKIARETEEAKSRYQDKIYQAELAIKQATSERDQLADYYVALGYAVDTTCPTCGQDLPPERAQELREKHATERMEVAKRGEAAAKKLAKARLGLITVKAEKIEPLSFDEYSAKILAAKKEDNELPKPVDIPIIDQQVLERIDELSKNLAHSEDIKDKQDRRKKLQKEERDLNREFEACESVLLDLSDFFFYRSEMVVKAVNSSFENISVKVLEIRKNGEPKETFEILKGGVPYSELNTAGQLEAGLELSNFLKENLNIVCPVLIDNGERYTDVDLSKLDGQLICAVATKAQSLEIVNKL